MVFYAIVDILSMKNSLRDRLNWRKERIYRVLTIFFICVRIFVVMKRSLEKDCDFFSFKTLVFLSETAYIFKTRRV